MNKLHCQVILESNAEHCHQIYTGLADLAYDGFLELDVKVSEKFTSNNFGKPIVFCTLNRSQNIVFDLSDSRKLIDEEALKAVDFYFKRSYDEDYTDRMKNGQKIRALGLNYLAYSKHGFWKERISASKNIKEKLKTFLRYNKFFSKRFNIQDSLYACETSNFESYPKVSDSPKVLFLVRAWKPENVSTEEKKLERYRMNDQRANIIRTLKKELGNKFVGGFLKEPYAETMYPDCVVSKNMTSKKNYLELMKDSDICIATTGLEESIGWKFAEYVAASNAIVSEKLMFTLPGDFKEGQNYLCFSSSEECVAQVNKLIEDKAMRLEMMHNNYKYYCSNVEPKKLVLNALLSTLKN